MATTYTNIERFQTDFFPTGTDEVFPRLVERAAVMAYNHINARLANVYTTPFSPVPPIIVDVSDLLTKCFVTSLQARKAPILPKSSAKTLEATDCALAADMLDMIATQDMPIPDLLPASATQSLHTMEGFTPVFAEDESTQHVVDPDLLDAIDDTRK